MKNIRLGLLPKIVIAIVLGIICSTFFPTFLTRIFVTVNGIFGNFLSFVIPLIILGLVAPGIAELGKGAGKLLGITALIAYLSTLISGFFSYFTCRWSYPLVLVKDPSFGANSQLGAAVIEPYMTIDMPPVMGVTTSLILAFVLGLGLAVINGSTFKSVLFDFRDLVTRLISSAIIPFLPIYIFGIFLKMGAEGQVGAVLQVFIKVIAIIFVMHVLLMLFQFIVAGAIAKKNPFKALVTMLPAYMTALGTQSSAATIPVTLEQAKKNGVVKQYQSCCRTRN